MKKKYARKEPPLSQEELAAIRRLLATPGHTAPGLAWPHYVYSHPDSSPNIAPNIAPIYQWTS